ncbi:MAG: endonuclease III [SAR324 cluster bacterium]|nr:endonuclease III [SAR324 cluster bacterium]
MNRARRNRLYEKLAAATPGAVTELKFRSPFELLVSVILSAQATDKSVNQVTAKLFKHHSTPQILIKLGNTRLHQAIRTIGLAPTKARNILATSRLLLERHGGEVPADREALEALPGVGRKTANVVLNVAFGQPTIAVDTHVFRVSNRTGLAPGRNVREVEEKLLENTPANHMRHAHHYLILHGRYVCKARKPECAVCVIEKECEFGGKNMD